MHMTEAKARKAALQLAATLLSQAAGDREGDHFQRLRRAGASEPDLEQLRLGMVGLVGELRTEARSTIPPSAGTAGVDMEE